MLLQGFFTKVISDHTITLQLLHMVTFMLPGQVLNFMEKYGMPDRPARKAVMQADRVGASEGC